MRGCLNPIWVDPSPFELLQAVSANIGVRNPRAVTQAGLAAVGLRVTETFRTHLPRVGGRRIAVAAWELVPGSSGEGFEETGRNIRPLTLLVHDVHETILLTLDCEDGPCGVDFYPFSENLVGHGVLPPPPLEKGESERHGFLIHVSSVQK